MGDADVIRCRDMQGKRIVADDRRIREGYEGQRWRRGLVGDDVDGDRLVRSRVAKTVQRESPDDRGPPGGQGERQLKGQSRNRPEDIPQVGEKKEAHAHPCFGRLRQGFEPDPSTRNGCHPSGDPERGQFRPNGVECPEAHHERLAGCGVAGRIDYLCYCQSVECIGGKRGIGGERHCLVAEDEIRPS